MNLAADVDVEVGEGGTAPIRVRRAIHDGLLQDGVGFILILAGMSRPIVCRFR